MLCAIHVFKIKAPKPESSYFIQKSMTWDPDRQIKCSLRIVALGHRLGFIANNLTPYTLSLSPFGLLFYEMHLFIFPKSKLQNLSQVILFRSQWPEILIDYIKWSLRIVPLGHRFGFIPIIWHPTLLLFLKLCYL